MSLRIYSEAVLLATISLKLDNPLHLLTEQTTTEMNGLNIRVVFLS